MNKRFINISLATLLLTSCEAMQTIDRGLYDVNNRLTTRDLITGKRTLSTADRKKQIAQGNAEAQKIINSYKEKGSKLNEELSSGQYNRAVSIFEKIHQVSHLRNEKWQVVLLPDSSFNAFVTGGTVLFINQGLMNTLSFDDEIAAVLAHEVAHVSANHIFERQGSSFASAIGGSKTAKNSIYQAAYSTNDEAEADKIGVLYMALAGYDPYAASRIWKKIYESRGNMGQMIQDHPTSVERIENTLRAAENVKQYQIPGEINTNFESILSGNSLYQTVPSSDMIGPQPALENTQANPPVGAGLAAALQTAGEYYQKKEEAKSQAVNQTIRVGTLQEIQKSMQIAGGKMIDGGKFEMNIQYNGALPVENLSVMAVSEARSSIYRHSAVVNPNTNFSAIFDASILEPVNGQKPKIKLVVDEGNYISN